MTRAKKQYPATMMMLTTMKKPPFFVVLLLSQLVEFSKKRSIKSIKR